VQVAGIGFAKWWGSARKSHVRHMRIGRRTAHGFRQGRDARGAGLGHGMGFGLGREHAGQRLAGPGLLAMRG
jgi:hypothetical protein